MILLIEDMQDDAEMITRALKEGGIGAEVVHVKTAGMAMEYFKNSRSIEAVISDVHIVGMMETSFFVDSMKNDARTSKIPVIITSIQHPDAKTVRLMKQYPELRFVSKDQQYEAYKQELLGKLSQRTGQS